MQPNLILAQGVTRVVSSAAVKPSLSGLGGAAVGLGIVGLAAGAAVRAGGAKSFMTLNYASIADPVLVDNDGGTSLREGKGRPLPLRVASTLARCLFVPGLAEEVFWRAALHPHPTIDLGGAAASLHAGHLGQILLVNAIFALYHPLVADLAGSCLETLGDFKSRAGVRSVFRHPTFLLLAFVLGNACSLSYIMAGGALYAPVLVHAVAVAVWLELLGGEKALQKEGGLLYRQ